MSSSNSSRCCSWCCSYCGDAKGRIVEIVRKEIVEIVDQPEDGIIGGFVYQKPDNRKARLTTQINLIMSDALRDMTLAALDSYGAFLLQHAKHDTQKRAKETQHGCLS